jgi:endoglucanase
LGPWFYFILFSFCSGTWLIAAETSDDYLFSIDSLTYDNLGNSVRLTGFAWFVFGTQNQVYHGLWSVNMEEVRDRVANLEFNVLRIP